LKKDTARRKGEIVSKPNRTQLVELVERLTDAFNRADLDEVMSFFTDGALFAGFDGEENRGKEAIRKAFEALFQGAFGEIRFHEQDIFVDETESKVLSRWRCTMEVEGKPQACDGLDIYVFEGTLIKEKNTYAKTDVLKLEAV